MKVGIITVHDSSNLGSFLQALAMQEIVKQQGDTPYIIESRSHLTTLALFLGYNRAKPVRSLGNFLRFVRSVLRNPKKIKTRYQKYLTYQEDWKQFDHIIKVQEAKKIGLDAILLGSDEIWNVNQPAFQNPILYGEHLEARRKVAYAISCGNATAAQLQKYPDLVNAIRGLDAIVIRDGHTAEQLAALQIPVAGRVCDPTIQADIRRYMSQKIQADTQTAPYIAIYAYSMSGETRAEIQKFAKVNGLKTVAVSLPQEWCDSYVNCSPLEFGTVLEGAKYVFTSTFHGTIFAALYHTNFVVDAKLPKVRDVLNLLGLERRTIGEPVIQEALSAKYSEEIDYQEFEERLASIREDSKKWYQYCVYGEDRNGNL